MFPKKYRASNAARTAHGSFGGSLFVTEHEPPVVSTALDSVHPIKESTPPLCLIHLKQEEITDPSEEDNEEEAPTYPQARCTPSATAVKTCADGNIFTSVAVGSNFKQGSDFISDFDDEIHVNVVDTAALLTEKRRDISDDDEVDEAILNAIERAMDDTADGMIGISNSFSWEKDFETFRGGPENFSGNTPGPVKDYDSPYDSFVEIWDEAIIQHISRETNRYAKQTIEVLIANNAQNQSFCLNEWATTDVNEIMLLFAVYIYMGNFKSAHLKEYWLMDDILEMSKVNEIMSYDRYVLLNKYLHFVDNICDNNTGNPTNADFLSPKLAKLEPILVHLNAKFSSVYNLDRNITIDDSLSLFKGHSWIQAIRLRNTRFGTKSYELCESSTGYLYRFQIYTGKNSARFDVASGIDLGSKSIIVVLELLKGLEHLGHCVTMNSFYNCPALSRYLKRLGIDCLGTLRTNRRHVPNEISKVSNSVARGTMIARHCGDISVLLWKDAKLVTMISTYHKKNTCVGSRAGKTFEKPVSVRDYNNAMDGIDLKNQRLSEYLLERKRGEKWYIKMFKRLLHVSIHNAFVMYVSSLKRRNKPLITHCEFRYSLAKSLVIKHNTRLSKISKTVGNLMRLRRDIVHVPKYSTGRNTRKRCQVCYRKKFAKLVHSQCITCNIFLCFEKCWTEWHSSEDL